MDAACLGFRKVPTDGSGLRPDLLALGRTFTKRYRQPAIFCSSEFVLPHFHSGHDGGAWGEGFQPPTARVLLMNLGEKGAKGVKLRLRSPGDRGQVWAEGLVDLPARRVTVAALPILPGKTYSGWVGTEEIEVVAPGCQVFTFRDSRFHPKAAAPAKAGPG